MSLRSSETVEGGEARRPRAWRIALSGPVGAGKSTLAQALSQRLALPLIPEGFAGVHAEVIRRARLRREPGVSEASLQAADRAAMGAFIEWMRGRERAYAERDGFVADRWEVDLLDAWLKLFAHLSPDSQTTAILRRMRVVAGRLDLVVLLPPPAFEVERFNDAGLPRKPGFSLKLQAYAMTSGLLRQCENLQVVALPSGQTVAARVEAVVRALAARDPASRRESKVSNPRLDTGVPVGPAPIN